MDSVVSGAGGCPGTFASSTCLHSLKLATRFSGLGSADVSEDGSFVSLLQIIAHTSQ